MSITSDLNTIQNSRDQADIALKYRTIFDELTTRLKKIDAELEVITLDTKFNAIPTDVKQALNQYWQAIKAFNAAVEGNANISEMLNWK